MPCIQRLICVAFATALACSPGYAGSGSIAVDANDRTIVGASFGSGSPNDAIRWAMQYCQQQGGTKCVTGWETNKCLVLAVGENGYGYGASMSLWNHWSAQQGDPNFDPGQRKERATSSGLEGLNEMYRAAGVTVIEEAKAVALNNCGQFTKDCKAVKFVCG